MGRQWNLLGRRAPGAGAEGVKRALDDRMWLQEEKEVERERVSHEFLERVAREVETRHARLVGEFAAETVLSQAMQVCLPYPPPPPVPVRLMKYALPAGEEEGEGAGEAGGDEEAEEEGEEEEDDDDEDD